MRSKLDLENTRNEQLSEELIALKEDLSMILCRINDEKVLIDALKMSNFSEPLSDHLKDIIDEKAKFCRQVQGSMKDEVPNQEIKYLERRSKIESERMKRKRAREQEGTEEAEPLSKKSKNEVIGQSQYHQPTNQDYLSYYAYHDEWKPTRPIPPIGAMSSSPGPAIVNLPTTIGEKKHDPTRQKAPGYKIGQRILEVKGQGIGPGPGTYCIRDVTNKGKGAVIAPKFGTAKRFNEKLAGYEGSTGMAQYKRYSRENLIYPRAPTYSVPHAERRETKIETVPSSNAYNLHPLLGKGLTPDIKRPEYSFGKDERMRKAKLEQPTNQDYLSYYAYRDEWKPTRPIPPIGAMSSSPGPAIVNLPTTIGSNAYNLHPLLGKGLTPDSKRPEYSFGKDERMRKAKLEQVSSKKHADSRYHKKKKE